ncbi:hypothetical protein E8E15_003709 [Penicillium rubens]|jgi:hypothetical protein|uniref:Uncharacterized protein n=2 Tax=Penicillium chrysogenum species complex TaxID=254878 RepID=B6HL85_PENRW|nr:uncharacterized protein N7525_007256 [Penicillium rubens]KZN88528.1 hypothetical protein EN45_071030 [Penicillium chrysogenum]CAP95688.1 hypothetical protein PCH_Pc21g07910 [Penicillium rubens Wisconsin 54-1255]KAF3027983.1 hypothetical protein E8E15_003709 [Penicillium rubens]KAJ5049356.1 hypothetical protein NUH16_007874 [Penicillium rubens]KAJ5829003.1 hypothetical protein N7525_007256 [Penicillium rubens]
MPNPEPAHSPYQKSFQKECRIFAKEAEALADYARQYPEDHEPKQNSDIHRGLISLWSQIARVKDTGLDMVAETPRCSLVLEERSYWFIRDLADQTEFEDECDEVEARLESLAIKVEGYEIENLWLAGFLESMALHVQDRFHV